MLAPGCRLVRSHHNFLGKNCKKLPILAFNFPGDGLFTLLQGSALVYFQNPNAGPELNT